MSKSVLKKCLNLEEKIHHEEKATIKSEKHKKRKNKNIRSLTDKGLKIRKIDYIEENVKLLTETNSTSIKINNIFDYHRGRLLKDQPKIRRTRQKKDETKATVFTEEDFIKFEQEYFVKGSA